MKEISVIDENCNKDIIILKRDFVRVCGKIIKYGHYKLYLKSTGNRIMNIDGYFQDIKSGKIFTEIIED